MIASGRITDRQCLVTEHQYSTDMFQMTSGQNLASMIQLQLYKCHGPGWTSSWFGILENT